MGDEFGWHWLVQVQYLSSSTAVRVQPSTAVQCQRLGCCGGRINGPRSSEHNTNPWNTTTLPLPGFDKSSLHVFVCVTLLLVPVLGFPRPNPNPKLIKLRCQVSRSDWFATGSHRHSRHTSDDERPARGAYNRSFALDGKVVGVAVI